MAHLANFFRVLFIAIQAIVITLLVNLVKTFWRKWCYFVLHGVNTKKWRWNLWRICVKLFKLVQDFIHRTSWNLLQRRYVREIFYNWSDMFLSMISNDDSQSTIWYDVNWLPNHHSGYATVFYYLALEFFFISWTWYSCMHVKNYLHK
jgi:hypothetical protein